MDLRPLDPPQPLVWINGWPAVGKQTVAQCITQILGRERAVLIDDRALTDQLDLPQGIPPPSCTRARGSSVAGLRPVLVSAAASSTASPATASAAEPSPTDPLSPLDPLDTCFQTYVEDPATRHRLVLFTECCADDADGATIAQRYADAARRAGRPFVPVYVECGLSENERRTQQSERRCHDGRHCDQQRHDGHAHADDNVGSHNKHCPLTEARELRARTGGRLFTFPQDASPGLFVDVTTQGVHDTAMEILAFINAVVEKRSDRVAATVIEAAARRPPSA